MLYTKLVSSKGQFIEVGDIVRAINRFSSGYCVGILTSIEDYASIITCNTGKITRYNKRIRNHDIQRWEVEDRI
jgi:hypothetical protein